MNMIQKLKKNKKGFTLVELLVVLVILAILAAAIIPSMMGFIDKAKEESVAAECRSVLLAGEVQVNEDYGLGLIKEGYTIDLAKVNEIADFTGTQTITAMAIDDVTAAHPKIVSATYTASNGKVYTYDGTTWTKTA